MMTALTNHTYSKHDITRHQTVNQKFAMQTITMIYQHHNNFYTLKTPTIPSYPPAPPEMQETDMLCRENDLLFSHLEIEPFSVTPVEADYTNTLQYQK